MKRKWIRRAFDSEHGVVNQLISRSGHVARWMLAELGSGPHPLTAIHMHRSAREASNKRDYGAVQNDGYALAGRRDAGTPRWLFLALGFSR